MRDTNNSLIKKQTKKIKKDKLIVIEELNSDCYALLYYENDKIKKSKVFQIPHASSLKRKVIKMINKEFHLWKKILWEEGYLDEDDIHLKGLDKIY